MSAKDLLVDAAQRPAQVAGDVLEGISGDTLHCMPGDTQNSIAWLIWHSARQQDAQIANLSQKQQVWAAQGWDEKFDLDRGPDDFGFGDGPEDVARVRVTDPDLLRDYLNAVTSATVDYLGTLRDSDLDQVIDDSWDPPVTRGVRIVSTIDDAAQHLGQAAYVRGLVQDSWRGKY
ncbi:DinB family protein [Kocuria sp. cx-455]|uniref:mycothiol transferase n=1 Tax=Kocuria sp. cx-455 TaxID=2771377 RepID=UPI0016887E10|nr:DinB family protein [Kocuria sp. cx-455]MBD2765760.1 DinB family protein [Kocuria sp. cx-455]